jgi:hypothetical protein
MTRHDTTRHDAGKAAMESTTAHETGTSEDARMTHILDVVTEALDLNVATLREISNPQERSMRAVSVLAQCAILLERMAGLTGSSRPTPTQEPLERPVEPLEGERRYGVMRRGVCGPQTGTQGFEPQEPVAEAEAEADECAYPVGSLWMDDRGRVWSVTRVRGVQGPDVTCVNWRGGPGEISLTAIQGVTDAPLIRIPECLRELWDPAQSQEDIPVYRYAWEPEQLPQEMRRGSVWQHPGRNRRKYVVIGSEPSTSKPILHMVASWCVRESWTEILQFAVSASAFTAPLRHVRG